VESRTRIELPPQVRRPFEVYVNGVLQVEGTDFEAVGTTLLFPRALAQEGKIGFWRWAMLFLGIAGTYRQNDTIAVVFTADGRRRVANIAPPAPEPAQGAPEGS
jgi:hypothetical protein